MLMRRPTNPLTAIHSNIRRNIKRWRDLTKKQQKIGKIIGGVGVAAASVAVIVAMWPKEARARRLVEVGPQCATFSITDEPKLAEELRKIVRAMSAGGAVDPLSLTARFVRRVGPQCPTYPGDTQNPGQVQLFASIYRRVLDAMTEENLLSPEDYNTWTSMMATWAQGQGVDPATL